MVALEYLFVAFLFLTLIVSSFLLFIWFTDDDEGNLSSDEEVFDKLFDGS